MNDSERRLRDALLNYADRYIRDHEKESTFITSLSDDAFDRKIIELSEELLHSVEDAADDWFKGVCR